MSLDPQVLNSIEGIVENYEQAIETFEEGALNGEISHEYAQEEILQLHNKIEALKKL